MTVRSPRTFAPTTWEEAAACVGWPEPDDFFPDRGDESPQVLMVCRGCPVLRSCGEQALRDRERYGIWGGLTERDRERVWEERARRRRTGSATTRSA